MHNTSHAIEESKQVMLDPYALYAPGLDLLRVKLLKTCGLWTFRNLLFDLLLLQNASIDSRYYMRWHVQFI
jgi:hypothetical protein